MLLYPIWSLSPGSRLVNTFNFSITIKNKDKSSTTLHIGKDGKHRETHSSHDHGLHNGHDHVNVDDVIEEAYLAPERHKSGNGYSPPR